MGNLFQMFQLILEVSPLLTIHRQFVIFLADKCLNSSPLCHHVDDHRIRAKIRAEFLLYAMNEITESIEFSTRCAEQGSCYVGEVGG